MKNAIKSALVLVLLSLSVSLFAQGSITCPPDIPCVQINPNAQGSPALQVNNQNRQSGIGVLLFNASGIGVWANANAAGGTGVWAVGSNGGTALKVQGPLVKARTARNLVRIYHPTTGALVGEYEFEFVQE